MINVMTPHIIKGKSFNQNLFTFVVLVGPSSKLWVSSAREGDEGNIGGGGGHVLTSRRENHWLNI